MINILIALVKNSSVAGAFFVLELFGYGRKLSNDYGDGALDLARSGILLPPDYSAVGSRGALC